MHLDERSSHVVRHGPRQQGLSGARGPIEEHTLGALDAHALEELLGRAWLHQEALRTEQGCYERGSWHGYERSDRTLLLTNRLVTRSEAPGRGPSPWP